MNLRTIAKNKVVVIVIAVIIIAGLGFYYYKTQPQPEETREVEESGQQAFEGDVSEATKNPLGGMPSPNPLEHISNPFRDWYKNPFAF